MLVYSRLARRGRWGECGGRRRSVGSGACGESFGSAEGQAILDEIEHDRTHLLQEIAEAYDPVIAPLPDLRIESESLSADGFKTWLETPDAAHPVWGKLAQPAQKIAALEARVEALGRADAEKKKTLQDELKTKKAALKTLTKEVKDAAKDRLKLVKAQIKALEKLEKEREERITEINRRAERETAEVNEAVTDLQRICSDPDEARRYFVIADKAEIEENEFNLNLPRYVDTFEPEEEIGLDAAVKELELAETATNAIRDKLSGLLKSGTSGENESNRIIDLNSAANPKGSKPLAGG